MGQTRTKSMDNRLISIIVPVYNAEKTIDACISSLIKQNEHRLEIILVNDGSRDHSLNRCREWGKQDARISLISQPNRGLSVARNNGFKYSHGSFIAFVDSDDYVEPNFISSLLKTMEKRSTVDLAIGGIRTDNPLYAPSSIPPKACIFPGRTYGNQIAAKPHLYDIAAWSKLYRRRLLDHLLFPPARIHEDEFTSYRFIDMSREVALVPQALYNYEFNPEGITGNPDPKGLLDLAEAFLEKAKYFYDNRYQTEAIDISLRRAILYTAQATANKQIRRQYANTLTLELNPELKKSEMELGNTLTPKTKIAGILEMLCPRLLGSLITKRS